RIRTGHVPLNKHLLRIAKNPSPTCQRCHQHVESVHAFIIIYPAYAMQRHALHREIGPRASHLTNLLNNRKCIMPLIASTHRLEQIFRDVGPPSDDELHSIYL
ncbi:hypothetical protein M405DRAFT_732277, partial [Rhizopogon salebrosus TDB-379]